MSETSAETPEFPEHEKMKAVQDAAQTIGEFLEWTRSDFDKEGLLEMFSEGTLDEEDLLYAYFDVDKKKIEAEKEAMLNLYVEGKAAAREEGN